MIGKIKLMHTLGQPPIGGAELSEARWQVIDQPRLLSWSAPVKFIHNNQVVPAEW